VKPVAAWAAVVALVALAVAGCGGSNTLSTAQLHDRATQACNLARRRTNRIATPTLPSEGARFLSRGIAAMAPELATLKTLRPPAGVAGDYTRARAASDGEVRALRSALKGLKAGNDPVVSIKTLQQELAPLEAKGDDAWRAAGIPACATG
jgi:hypothetical protein